MSEKDERSQVIEEIMMLRGVSREQAETMYDEMQQGERDELIDEVWS